MSTRKRQALDMLILILVVLGYCILFTFYDSNVRIISYMNDFNIEYYMIQTNLFTGIPNNSTTHLRTFGDSGVYVALQQTSVVISDE